MSRIAILGGSFNPPHVGHQMIALWVLSTKQVDAVWLVPCFQHPFGKELEEYHHRIAMCQLAAQTFEKDKVHVSTAEQGLNQSGRTLFLIKHLLKHHPNHLFSLVIGADILRERKSWLGFDEIEKLVPIIVVGRAGYDSPSADVPILPAISSTEIRQRISRKKNISPFVPRSVLEYIKKHGLYGM